MTTPAPHVLVLGGQRSGKSRYAAKFTERSAAKRIYLATATAGDAEMAARIARHRADRGAGWQTVEEPLDVPAAVLGSARAGCAVLVDCLTLWLANLMGAERDIDEATEALAGALADAQGTVVLVSNEVGSGIIPANALARAYADAHGILNQRIAAVVGRVILVAAGLPLVLKPNPQAELLP